LGARLRHRRRGVLDCHDAAASRTESHGAPKLQVLASDIDEHALETARMGRYPAAIAKDVPAKILEHYFLREDGTYRITNNLREICLFSSHNLLRDAPFQDWI
jgi:two-component system, chemotaxis family, CheB/CheR fusion protein